MVIGMAMMTAYEAQSLTSKELSALQLTAEKA